MTIEQKTVGTGADDAIVEVIDATGLLCPLPVYKTGIALARLRPGERLRLLTTDPGALQDIPAMARQRGDIVVESTESGGTTTFVIERGAGT